jgi:hypothetical protein
VKKWVIDEISCGKGKGSGRTAFMQKGAGRVDQRLRLVAVG